MRQENAAERVRRRIAAWIKAQGHGVQTQIAETVTGLYGVPRSASWVTDIKKGRQDVRLADLDGIAKAMGLQPGDLVRKEGHTYAELTASEARLLKYFRSVPDVVRGHWISTLDYMMEFQQKAMQEQAAERDRRTAAARDELTRRNA